VLHDSLGVQTPFRPTPPTVPALCGRASSGIGRSAAVALAKEGFTVYAGVRKEADAESIRALAATVNPGVLKPLLIDVANSETITNAVAEVTAAGVSDTPPITPLLTSLCMCNGRSVKSQDVFTQSWTACQLYRMGRCAP
jgi:hypothetical protein